MPGIFGIVSRDIAQLNRFHATSMRDSRFNHDVKRTSTCLIGSHAFEGSGIIEDQRRVVAVDGEFGIYQALADSPDVLYAHVDGKIATSGKCKGNLCVLDKVNETIHLVSDLLGCFPLYYAIVKDVFVFSSRQKSLGMYLSDSHDAVGIVEFYLGGCTFNDRTFYRKIRRVRPGEIVSVDLRTLEHRVDSYSKLWATEPYVDTRTQLVDHAAELLTKSIDLEQNTLLMMSAGWDSRSILAAGIASGKAGRFTAYSHGDIHSRELGIVERITKRAKIDLVKQSIDGRMYAIDILRNDLDYSENAICPHWHWAGELARTFGVRQITAGIYGEAFGGHYGPPMVLRGSSKMLSIAKYLLHPQDPDPRDLRPDEAFQNAARLLKFTGVHKLWFISDDFWEQSVSHITEKLNEDIESALLRYQRRGVTTPENYIEAFITEHRGSQYVNSQLLSCRHYVDICLPFADRELMEFATKLPFREKVHNRLNQAVLRRIAPELLDFPMAATLLPARNPIILQEASRAARKMLEGVNWKLHRMSKGLIGQPRMAWVDYQFLAHGNILSDVIDSLKQPYWDKQKMKSAVEKLGRASFHPTADMLMKLLTIDYCLDT